MRINLLDPGLLSSAGHHLDLDLKLARYLTETGNSVRIYANSRVEDDVLSAFEPFCEAEALFQRGPYWRPETIDPFAGELFGYSQHSKLLHRDLASTTEADVWLWPSITAVQLRACAGISGKALVSGCAHNPVNAPYLASSQMWWRHALVSANRSDMRLRLGTLDRIQCEDLSPLTSQYNIKLFPIFKDAQPNVTQKKKLKKIGFFGHQRAGEKGRDIIVAMIPELLAKGYELVVQDSSESMRSRDARLGPKVLGYVDDLTTEISKCDLVVLPYAPEDYRKRTSGVLWDALACGVPAVVPADTVPADLVERTGGGILFSSYNMAGVVKAVDDAQFNFPAIAKAAHATAINWSNHAGLDKFAEAMLAKT